MRLNINGKTEYINRKLTHNFDYTHKKVEFKATDKYYPASNTNLSNVKFINGFKSSKEEPECKNNKVFGIFATS